MRHHAVAFLLLASFTVACAHNPARGLTSLDGQTLSIEPTYDSYARTADTTYRNPDGSLAGTSTSVVGYERYRSGFEYKLGNKRIDEQDFYQLAGDSQTANKIKNRRERGVFFTKLGTGTIVGSLAGAVLLGVLLPSNKDMLGYSTGPSTGLYLGALLVLVGGLTGTFEWLHGSALISQQQSAASGFKAIGQSPASWALPLQ
jgi:hypothetical protein